MLTVNHPLRRPTLTLSAPLLAAAFLAIPGPGAGATIIAPGATIPTPGTTVSLRPELEGLVLQDVLHPFTIPEGIGSFSGTFQDRVILLFDNGVDVTGGTHLSFEYAIRDTSAVSKAAAFPDFPLLQSVSRIFFDTPLTTFTDVDVRLDSLGTRTADSATRTGGLGSTISFLYSNGVDGSTMERTHETFIRTAALSYSDQGRVTLTTVAGSSVTFNVFEPAVPAPAGAGALGIGMLAALRRRR